MDSYLRKPYLLGSRGVPNRFVAQAMEINSCIENGEVNDRIISRYEDLARGEWGIVFLEATSITEKHLARDKGLILNKKNLDGFKRLVDSFKAVNDKSLFMFQLTHSGRQSGDFSQKVKVYEDDQTSIPVLTESLLDEIQEQFIEAVKLSKEAGADGVDIKSCHGYLGGELLRPLNNRNDKYGGDVKGRAYLTSSVMEAASREFPDLIIGARVSLFEGIRGGCGTEDSNEIIENLKDMGEILSIFKNSGAHYLNISAGIPPVTPQITRPFKKGEFYRLNHFRYTKTIKEQFPDTAVIGSTYSTGNPDCISFAEENLSKGYTDFAGFGRQNLADPMFPKKVIENPDTINYCKLCGKCSVLLKKNDNVYCETFNN